MISLRVSLAEDPFYADIDSALDAWGTPIGPQAVAEGLQLVSLLILDTSQSK